MCAPLECRQPWLAGPAGAKADVAWRRKRRVLTVGVEEEFLVLEPGGAATGAGTGTDPQRLVGPRRDPSSVRGFPGRCRGSRRLCGLRTGRHTAPGVGTLVRVGATPSGAEDPCLLLLELGFAQDSLCLQFAELLELLQLVRHVVCGRSLRRALLVCLLLVCLR